MTDIDFDAIKRDYSMPEIASKGGLKLDANGHEFIGCCPFHGEKTPSFTMYPSQSGWRFHCFGCGAHGDNLDLVQELYQVSHREAAEIITGDDMSYKPVAKDFTFTKDAYHGYSIISPPEHAPPLLVGARTPPILNPKRLDSDGKPKVVTYTPKEVYPYRGKDGSLKGYVIRVEFDGRKITPGVWWTVNKEVGFTGWSHGKLPEPRLLYNLHMLVDRPQAQVLLVEGEKCADRANQVLGDKVVSVTWPGGGKSIAKVNWKYLKGRSVVVWPDNDVEGWRTTLGYCENGRWVKGIIELLHEAGAERVKVVHITRNERPDGWDIADAVDKDKLTGEHIGLIIRSQIQEWSADRMRSFKEREIENYAKGTTAQQDTSGVGQASGMEEGRQIEGPARSPRLESDERGEAGEADAAPQQTRQIRGFQISDDTWRQHLIMKADGDGLKPNSLQNYALLLQYEPRFANIFALNEFSKKVYLMRRPPWDVSGDLAKWTPRPTSDSDAVAAACWLEYCGMSPKVGDVEKVMLRVAAHNKFNPVTDKLDTLKWDGVKRLQEDKDAPGWLSYYLGADDTHINQIFGMKWLVGAVARAYQPGIKMDTMLILEGAQGLKKSTALRIIADAIAPNLFTDEMSDPSSKDAGMQMQGAWVVEIAELDAFRAAEVTTLKAWLARQVDRFRPPYGRLVAEFPRTCVFAGTVNPSGAGYLKDSTGNRRFWPVKCAAIDIDGLSRDAVQLWAEAVHCYRNGVQWWLEETEETLARFIQDQRYEEDPWSRLIKDSVIGKTHVRVVDVMKDLDIPKKDMNVFVNHRIAKYLQKQGWIRTKIDEETVFHKPEEELL